MALNLVALQRKLGAILAKNPDAIVAQGVSLPFIAPGYTKATLVAWLATISSQLQTIVLNNYSDAQIATLIANIRATLGTADQITCDAITNGTPYVLAPATASAYSKLVQVILYKFATTP